MAGVKISALPVSPGLDGTEIVPIVDGGVTRRTTVNAISALGTADLTSYVGETVNLHTTGVDGITLEAINGGISIDALSAIGIVCVEGNIEITTDQNNIWLNSADSINLDAAASLNISGRGANSGLFISSNNPPVISVASDEDDATILISSTGINGAVSLDAINTGGTIVGNAEFITLTASGATMGASVGLIASNPAGVVYISAGGPFPDGTTAVVLTPPIISLQAMEITGQIDLVAGELVSLQSPAAVQIQANPTGLLGFFNVSPVAQPTGVAVNAAAIHAALVSLGLIAE